MEFYENIRTYPAGWLQMVISRRLFWNAGKNGMCKTLWNLWKLFLVENRL